MRVVGKTCDPRWYWCTDLVAVRRDGEVEAIRRLPGGEALRGLDESDDGHLEVLRTGRRARWSGERFRVTVGPA